MLAAGSGAGRFPRDQATGQGKYLGAVCRGGPKTDAFLLGVSSLTTAPCCHPYVATKSTIAFLALDIWPPLCLIDKRLVNRRFGTDIKHISPPHLELLFWYILAKTRPFNNTLVTGGVAPQPQSHHHGPLCKGCFATTRYAANSSGEMLRKMSLPRCQMVFGPSWLPF